MKLIRAGQRPEESAVYQGDDVWFVSDDHPSAALKVSDVPRRTDLPKGHPLYGKRVLAVVEAGQPSQVMMNDGRILPNGREPIGVRHGE